MPKHGKLPPFFLSSLLIATIFTVFILYSPNPLNPFSKRHLHQTLALLQPPNSTFHGDDYNDILSCDLFNGEWIPDPQGSLYTNSSCSTIPSSKNCFRHGRKDKEFLNWRWKPHECVLPRFDPQIFLEFVHGKKLAFVGDSVARNHMESLLCLLSKVETPIDRYEDSEDRKRIWYFPGHEFTLMILWTKFLVDGEERVINGSSSGVFDVHLDKVDENWSKDLPAIDYIIISDSHWFFRTIYLHDDTGVVGCVYCDTPNVTDYGVGIALRMAVRSALNHINRCENCKVRVTLVRTISPAHFENGTWDSGGRCNRTRPLSEREINLRSNEWELRSLQMEEIEKANVEGKKKGKKFVAMDVTRAMLMRPDGHPGEFWGNKWMKGYNDCVHWCLPGPIDVWNDFLMAVMKREA
ncbi:TRICHOME BIREFRINGENCE-LIKE 22, ALTERED XYLOGLUCAN 4-LIKE [Hibiscus trionum]|uniref:TRICHOME BIREFRINGENCE-LIKE 22, ALTERED XYLOGLUCAN 4-LIKE n=1 Tax=Hibiscus trionum TaxID=183268 RepID=A0A9W7GWW8_HIBTR|nr:TRICHOME BIREFRINGENCE-LIKE 22, ALTERED XYLOGLUCAN 4-LIKE [Hibiscus trionum]GMI67056.1 TRICHOME BIREFRINGENCE-LIKE 22, ALTERED XYLOGLUCAN 4-LIKE [Hibiscus trionum]GMI67059.1 TRICHOME BIREFRINGENCE-LIKE 22, ALTERED XYLOGLUCAN 4-LIKE [Hibiscus trionum]GMI67062.1 TRICHOME BIREFRINGENCE-LIKE 22, ALTERED XYLOGLUCAN 4-LIKE [Hibiscus trionum]GMI67065.1 TRICHOME BIREFRINGENCE-LIKE 22, ALTERED XYLOGLUCAN 4-LIKE [Hibiscus trionum]